MSDSASLTSGYCQHHGPWTAQAHMCPRCTAAGPVEAATNLAHRHRWTFDSTYGGWALYHCDEHDPPIVRKVWLEGVTL